MNNFVFHTPTKILFGKGQVESLGKEVAPIAKKVLLAYGSGSVKKIGLYDKTVSILKENGIEFVELSGIEPNPKLESVVEGVKLCRENKLQAIVAIGGGSVIDCSKAISAAIGYDGNPWDLLLDSSLITSAIPIFTVLTLSATGTEMNGNAVISNMQTNEKKALKSPLVKPVCSILDPEYTFTVSPWQTASGTADIMSHIFEVYFSNAKGAFVTDGISEALLKVCIECGERVFNNPDDYEARANLMWASSLAINGLLAAGKAGEPWSCHAMEHQLSAYYDITHGAGLATITPSWFRFILSENTVDKFVSYGVNVWGIDKNLDSFEIANKSIEKTEEFFFNTLKLPRTLKEYGIDETYLLDMAEKAEREHLNKAVIPLTANDVLKIYKDCLE
ncbi:MAG: iron-containing alcohol dehydrogenase [Ruminococcaceae bacterium]|nr:iron-containing alcohol dehydrogenase [Oscillospiraceae bacterium]